MKKLNTVLKEVSRNGIVKFPINDTQSFRSLPIDNLNLDTRSSNALKRCHIETIGQLLDDIGVLNKIKGLGTKSRSNILYGLCAFQYNQLDMEKKSKYLLKIVKMNTENI